MSCELSEAQVDLDANESPAGEESIREQVRGLLAAMEPCGKRPERRSDRRHPYPYLIYLTPVSKGRLIPQGKPVVVVGKHLSEHGLGFYHPQPLSFRHVIATLETAVGARIGFLMDLTWCRFTREGWYESGGRFLGLVPSPISVDS
jgi:hypothetical protein